jgi:hypothetical protein
MHIKIHEDNVGTLLLGQLEPQQMTPHSKHYSVKYHWFWEHLVPCKIQLVKIATKDQLGDIFNKGLDKAIYKYLRKMLMGWRSHSALLRGSIAVLVRVLVLTCKGRVQGRQGRNLRLQGQRRRLLRLQLPYQRSFPAQRLVEENAHLNNW